jgi:hypothetical protein
LYDGEVRSHWMFLYATGWRKEEARKKSMFFLGSALYFQE